MTEKIVEGVKVEETGHKHWELDYKQSDMESAYRYSQPSSWDSLISWLEQHGEAKKRLTPGETVALVEDLRSVRSSGAPFSSDPDKAFEMAHKHRGENKQKFAQQHAQEGERGKMQKS